MNQFIIGAILGSLLTVGLVEAGTRFYDSNGHPNAPQGSVQQFDYFRQRQQYLDLNAMRRAQEESLRANPCGR